MSRAYIYVVDRDFGFAPNPFHGFLTLATCKPRIRRRAELNDWVIGMGGARLRATGRCVFAARVTGHKTFNEYWADPACRDKKPVRNGSRRMMVGDNIYHFDAAGRRWRQANSHHSYADGSVNAHNVRIDTQADRVLLSRHFFYFGQDAPAVPGRLLTAIGYRNGRGYRVYPLPMCAELIAWLEMTFAPLLNRVVADPFDFENSEKRYSAGNNRISQS